MLTHLVRFANIRGCIYALIILSARYQSANGIYDFPKHMNSPIINFDEITPNDFACRTYQRLADDLIPHDDVSDSVREYLSKITIEEWQNYVKTGVESVNKQRQLEENLLSSQITVQNGSISHTQLLDSLPNLEAQKDSDVAMKIVKASLYVYNTKCVQNGIDGVECEAFLDDQLLPESELRRECESILNSQRDGHHPFRRLLPQKYKDGFYEMFPETQLPYPRLISTKALSNQPSPNILDENQRTLALIQWTQFIEHDLSKPVVTSMSNGSPIECCNKDNYKLAPRYNHPACAPLLDKDESNKYGRETCLNYVRSALAVGKKCTFSGAEQLNLATGYFDLSQLYGFTENAEQRMRTFQDGEIKSTPSAQKHRSLLPLASNLTNAFCALKVESSVSTCFMAGDSRVNSNPFSIVIYTIFMRNHNRIASQLKLKHSDWSDERLFKTARAINVDIYRRIIFNEWLPEVIGSAVTDAIFKGPIVVTRSESGFTEEDMQVSNEFAVAALRFYFSMMPNSVHDFSDNRPKPTQNRPSANNNALPDPNIFVLKDQFYNPDLIYTSKKLDDILQSVLHQRAMKLDPQYVESLVPESGGSTRPTHADVLAFDIQRGRDHGLQGYVKYLEICSGVKINRWRDLEDFISLQNIAKLNSVYKNLDDIDLVVGGISENAVNGSTVGPTFTCIIAEQFSKIRQWQDLLGSKKSDSSDLMNYKSISAIDLLCANSDLQYVPKNVFQLASDKNPLISCEDRLSNVKVSN